MTTALWIIAALLALDAGALALVLYCRLASAPAAVSVSDLGPFIAIAGVLTALVAFLFNLRRGRSTDILEAATDLLEKGYASLESEKDSPTPTSRRLAWLTAARLIATAEMLEKKITEPSHREVYVQKREYWRTRLYELIFPSSPEGLPGSFYADKPEHMIAHLAQEREPLSERSLAFLYRFIRWPDETSDPIGKVTAFTEEEIAHMQSFGPRGLGNLLSAVRQLKK